MNDMIEVVPTRSARTAPNLTCQVDITLPTLSLSSLVRRGRGFAYRIGRVGPVGFSIERPGMFAAQGQAERVDGWLSLDTADGSIATLDLEIDPGTSSLCWTDMVAGVRPVRGLPRLHFRSTASLPTRSNRRNLRGLLDIDGTPRLQTMEMTLLDRPRDSITGTEIASYRLDGQIDLASFTLPREVSLLGNPIMLSMRVDVEISPGD